MFHQRLEAFGTGGIQFGQMWGVTFQQFTDIVGAVVPQPRMLDEQALPLLLQEIGRTTIGRNHAFFHQPVGFVLHCRFNHPDPLVFVQTQPEFGAIIAQ